MLSAITETSKLFEAISMFFVTAFNVFQYSIQKSKFDKDVSKIKELLKLGLSVSKISRFFDYNNHISLNPYIQKRKLKDSLNGDNNTSFSMV